MKVNKGLKLMMVTSIESKKNETIELKLPAQNLSSHDLQSSREIEENPFKRQKNIIESKEPSTSGRDPNWLKKHIQCKKNSS